MIITNYNYKIADLDHIPIQEDWNMGDERESRMHSIHAYPAKFPAFITTKAIQYATNLQIPVNIVADIFVVVELLHMKLYVMTNSFGAVILILLLL